MPAVTVALKVAGSVYLLWLAWGLVRRRRAAAGRSAQPMSVWQAIAFQLVNAKAWIFALGAVTTFAPPGLPGLAGGAVVADGHGARDPADGRAVGRRRRPLARLVASPRARRS